MVTLLIMASDAERAICAFTHPLSLRAQLLVCLAVLSFPGRDNPLTPVAACHEGLHTVYTASW